MTNNIPLQLSYEGSVYQGYAEPSEDKNDNGIPVYFRVTLNGNFFGYLCCSDTGWISDHRQQKSLVNAIGDTILGKYRQPQN